MVGLMLGFVAFQSCSDSNTLNPSSKSQTKTNLVTSSVPNYVSDVLFTEYRNSFLTAIYNVEEQLNINDTIALDSMLVLMGNQGSSLDSLHVLMNGNSLLFLDPFTTARELAYQLELKYPGFKSDGFIIHQNYFDKLPTPGPVPPAPVAPYIGGCSEAFILCHDDAEEDYMWAIGGLVAAEIASGGAATPAVLTLAAAATAKLGRDKYKCIKEYHKCKKG